MTAMLDEDRFAAGERLRKLIPLLKKRYPKGWKDFRGPMVPGWRAGVFVKCLYKVSALNLNGPHSPGDPPETPLKLKAMFGSEETAIRASVAVRRFCKVDCMFTPPDSPNGYWTITWEVPVSEVCW